jgi:hypothetical protein
MYISMKKFIRFTCFVAFALLLVGQKTPPFVALSKVSDHGIFLKASGKVEGYFKIQNISGDTLKHLDFKWSWGGGCDLHLFRYNNIYPGETGLVLYSANVVDGRYLGNIDEMLADTLNPKAQRSTEFMIRRWDPPLDNGGLNSFRVDFWPAPISGVEEGGPLDLKASHFDKIDLNAGIQAAALPYLRKWSNQSDPHRPVTLTGLMEIENVSAGCSFGLSEVKVVSESGVTVTPVALFTMLHPHTSFVYQVDWVLSQEQYDKLMERKGQKEMEFKLQFVNRAGRRIEIRRVVKFDLDGVNAEDVKRF